MEDKESIISTKLDFLLTEGVGDFSFRRLVVSPSLPSRLGVTRLSFLIWCKLGMDVGVWGMGAIYQLTLRTKSSYLPWTHLPANIISRLIKLEILYPFQIPQHIIFLCPSGGQRLLSSKHTNLAKQEAHK